MSFDFMNGMKEQLDNRKTFTENGAVAFATSGKELLDFNFATTALRKMSDEEIATEYTKVYFEDPLIAVQYLFWLRDCRGGNGERKIFRVCFKWLAENKPEIAKATIKFIPEFGRWDDLYCVAGTNLFDSALDIISKQIAEDVENCMNGKNISLAAKWLKSENASSKETCNLARKTMEYMRLSPRAYRRTLSKLREHLDVVERKMTAKKWDEIDYEKVSSQANLKYSNAFLRNDKERRSGYLESLKKGEAKINASVLQPHEIVAKYNLYYQRKRSCDEALEQLWLALPNIMVENCLVCRDGSGSMTWGTSNVRPLDIATSLAIYTSEHNSGFWRNKYITFGARPQIVDLSNCKFLQDKLELSYKYADCSNTDIEATMMLVLNTAIMNRCTQEDMPKSILIISDMQFDHSYSGRVDKALFEEIGEAYTAAGYMMPRLVFWNVNEQMSRQNIPLQQNKLGVVLMSGYSTQLLKMAMSGEVDPYKVLLEAINSDRYLPIKEAVKNLV